MAYDLDEWKMIVATFALLLCIIWDILAIKRCVDVSRWSIPSNLFVLNALTIQIVSFVDIEKWTALNESGGNKFEMLLDNQLKIDAARLTMCVFMGCILSGVAMAGTEGGWTSVAALFISLSFHIATEIYVLENGSNSNVEREAGPWFVFSGVIFILGAFCLVILLGIVFFCGKMAQESDYHSPIKIYPGYHEEEDNGTLRELMKSWVDVRAWKIQYFIINSVFSPGAGMIVTICVVAMLVKLVCRSSLLQHMKGEGDFSFIVQCIFILAGWILMLYRWFKGSFYCANLTGEAYNIFLVLPVITLKVFSTWMLYRLSSFIWNRHIALRILVCISCLVPLLLFCVFISPVALLLLFCSICFRFSVLVFGNRFVQRLGGSDIEPFLDCEPYRARDRIFWEMYKKPYAKVKSRMNESRDNIKQSCGELLNSKIMGEHKLTKGQILRLDNSERHYWMEAVSRIFKATNDADIGLDMRDALKAYRETKDVLIFVDRRPDERALNRTSLFDKSSVKGFLNCAVWEMKMYGVEDSCSAHLQKRRERVEGSKLTSEERERMRELIRDIRTWIELFFGKDDLIRFPEKVEELDEWAKKLPTLVGHVIISAVSEAEDVIVKYTKNRAENFDEASIEQIIELARKVIGLLESLITG